MGNTLRRKTMKFITLPSKKRVSLGTYARAWKALRAMTADQRERYIDYNWDWCMNDGNDILRQMRQGLHDRINQRGEAK